MNLSCIHNKKLPLDFTPLYLCKYLWLTTFSHTHINFIYYTVCGTNLINFNTIKKKEYFFKFWGKSCRSIPDPQGSKNIPSLIWTWWPSRRHYINPQSEYTQLHFFISKDLKSNPYPGESSCDHCTHLPNILRMDVRKFINKLCLCLPCGMIVNSKNWLHLVLVMRPRNK